MRDRGGGGRGWGRRGGRTLQGCSACLNIHKRRKQCETHSEGENRIPAVNQTFAGISSAFFVLTECKLSSADLTPATFAADLKVGVVFSEAKMKQ